MSSSLRLQKGFTIVELVVVVAVMALLVSLFMTNYLVSLERGRDAKRLKDMKEIENALQLYWADYGTYPNPTTAGSGSLAGWEVSSKPDFMEYLIPTYMTRVPLDPLNTTDFATINMFFTPRPKDRNFFYNYYFYNWDTAGQHYGCKWRGPFAVLGFRALENMSVANLPKARCGPQPCALGGQNLGTPTACRDWSNEFDYSVFLVPP